MNLPAVIVLSVCFLQICRLNAENYWTDEIQMYSKINRIADFIAVDDFKMLEEKNSLSEELHDDRFRIAFSQMSAVKLFPDYESDERRTEETVLSADNIHEIRIAGEFQKESLKLPGNGQLQLAVKKNRVSFRIRKVFDTEEIFGKHYRFSLTAQKYRLFGKNNGESIGIYYPELKQCELIECAPFCGIRVTRVYFNKDYPQENGFVFPVKKRIFGNRILPAELVFSSHRKTAVKNYTYDILPGCQPSPKIKSERSSFESCIVFNKKISRESEILNIADISGKSGWQLDVSHILLSEKFLIIFPDSDDKKIYRPVF